MPSVASFAYMFTLLVAVLLMLFVVTRDGYHKAGWAMLGLHRAGLRAWLPAVLVPLAVMSLAYGFVWISGIATFAIPANIFGVDISPRWLVPLVIWLVIQATVANPLGEEMGWRGYLLTHLEPLGAWQAALLSGLLHGIWNLPPILMTRLYHPTVMVQP